MDPSRASQSALFAPGSVASSVAAYAPGRHERLPAVDERLVAPESHAEILMAGIGAGVVGASGEISPGGAAFGLAATPVGRSSHGPHEPLSNTCQGILSGLTSA